MKYLILCLLLSGCVTALPSVAGKTIYNVKFSDVTADQNTNYEMHIKAPAGVDLASVTGMTYDWQPDGSGAINVSQKGNVNTETQAALIQEVSQQQVQSLTVFLNALAPFLGQKLQADTDKAAIDADLKNKQLQLIDRLMEKTK